MRAIEYKRKRFLFLLPDPNIYCAHLEDAILVYARLEGANLNGARLQGAQFDKAYLQGSELVGTDLTKDQFDSAITDENTLVRPTSNGRRNPTRPPARYPKPDTK